MKKFNYLMSFIALGAVLTSCQKEEFDASVSPDIDETLEHLVTISASAPASDTKVSIDGLKFSWEGGDKLTVCKQPILTAAQLSDAQHRKIFTAEEGSSGNKASFTGTIGPTALKVKEYVYAIYPNLVDEKFSLENGRTPNRHIKYTFTIPTLQNNTYLENSDIDPTAIDQYVLMYGRSTEAGTSHDISVSMKHLMTYFDLQLTGLDPTKSIDSVVLRSALDAFAITADYKCYPMSTTAYTTGIAFGNKQTFVSTKLYASNGDFGVKPKADGTLTVRLAVTLAKSLTGTRMAVTAYSNNVLIGEDNDHMLLKPSYLPGYSYTPTITLKEPVRTTVADAVKTEGTPFAVNVDTKDIESLTITGGALDSLDFVYIRNNMIYLKKLDISGTQTAEIPANAFNTCDALEEVVFNTTGELKIINGGAFRSTSLTSVIIPASVEEILSEAFQKTKLKTVTFEDNSALHTFGGGVFHSTQLTTLTIPKNVTKIGTYFCNSCVALETLSFEEPSMMRKLSGSLAIKSGIKTVTLPENLDTLGNGVFSGCASLNNVVVPATVKSMGTTIFNQCAALTTITFEGEVPPTIATNTFIGSGNNDNARAKNTPPIANIYVPSSKVIDYQNAQTWIDHVTHSHGEPATPPVALTTLVSPKP